MAKRASAARTTRRAAAKRGRTAQHAGKKRAAARPANGATKQGKSRNAAPRAGAKGKATGRGHRPTSAKRAPSRDGARASGVKTAVTAVRGAVAGAVAAVRRTVTGRRDAVALLEADHRRMERLLKRGEETTAREGRGRADVLDTLTAELTIHEALEERVLYPALEQHPEARDGALEGFQEHHLADVVVKELHEMPPDDEQWGAKFTVLKETIQHHIDEEEGEMFRTARGLFSQGELEAMAGQMVEIKARMKRGAR